MSEIRQAFAHPEVRAEATSGTAPLDRISLRDHTVEVEIGAFQAERGVTQRISFNIVVELAPFEGPIDDDVDRILSYDRLTEAIAFELEAERLNLLETLAERIAERILTEPQAHRVFVRIEKLDRGPGALGVEIVRSMGQLGERASQIEAPVPHPIVLHLSSEAFAAPTLSLWLDRCAQAARPVILTVGLPQSRAPQSAIAAVQRRIDFLAIEQQAWLLAAKDNRCVVRDSRTELDWAMKHDQISVWAPSKMVLDATDGPEGAPVDLAKWLAKELNAEAFWQLGGEGADLPLEGPIDLPRQAQDT